jgi:translation initiation factor 2 beta subunit (eIF-2beta)/eIF-5
MENEDKFGNIHISDCRIAVRCLICDEYQEISQAEAESIHILVCEDCKRAMGWLKEWIRNQKNGRAYI